KAAGTRARKASIEIEKALKEFRKESLDASRS
ncbi:MAG: histone H1, partial [Bacteroides sp.]|nr:histone H1 [Bacteroides sp.]